MLKIQVWQFNYRWVTKIYSNSSICSIGYTKY